MSIRFVVLIVSLLALISCDGAEERQAFYLDKAKSSMSNKDYEKAIIDLKNALQIEPKNSEVVYLLGSVLENQDKFEAAYKHFLRAVEYDEKNIDARFHLARVYIQTLQVDKAEEEIAQIENISPGHVYVKSLRAAVYYSNKDYEAVIMVINTIDPADISENDYMLHALSSLRLDKESEAVSILEVASDKFPDNIKIYELLAIQYEHAGNTKEAALVYKKITAVNKEKNIHDFINLSNF